MQKNIIKLLVVAVLISAVHGWISSRNLDHPPHFDEMYHILAAESYKTEGSYRILDGQYTRASLYTKLVASRLLIFENSIESARVINIIFSVIILIGMVYLVGIFFNIYVAVLAGIFIATNPEIVTAAHTVRFYTLHSGIFFAFAITFLYIFLKCKNNKNPSIFIFIFVMLLLLLIAYQLQVTTIIGIAGMMVGYVFANIYDIYNWINRRGIIKIIRDLLLLIGMITCGVIILNDELIALINNYKSYPEWARTHASNNLYYYYKFEQWYPAIWPLTPILCVFSFIRWPKETVYFSSIFIITFIILSLSPQKETRYICFVIPFSAIPISAGLVVLGNAVAYYLKNGIKILPKTTLSKLYFSLISLAIILFVISQPVVRSSYGLIAHGNPSDFYYNLHQPDWETASTSVKSQLTGTYTLIASAGVKAAYYFGDYSYDINKGLVAETNTGKEFGLDLRTGRRAISSTSSLEHILKNCTSVIVVLEAKHINGIAVDPNILNILNKYGHQIKLNNNDIYVWKIDNEPVNLQTSEQQIEYKNGLCEKIVM